MSESIFKKTILRALLIVAAAALAGLFFNLLAPQGLGLLPPEVSRPLWKPVSMTDAADLRENGAMFIDARDPGDYKQAHIRGAVNLNREEWDKLYPLLEEVLRGAPTLVVYGRSRSRHPAAWVAQRLRELEFADVRVMQATFEQWREAGLPVRAKRRRNN